jgi:hypothetical protein
MGHTYHHQHHLILQMNAVYNGLQRPNRNYIIAQCKTWVRGMSVLATPVNLGGANMIKTGELTLEENGNNSRMVLES